MAEIDVFKEVLIALRQILRTMEAQSKVLARQTGLSTAQFIALQLIDAAGRMTAGELARELLLSQGTVTSIITRLEARALIARTRDELDKRCVVLTLTPAGQDLLAATPRVLQNVFERRFADLEGWEQMQVLAGLRRTSALMNAADVEASPVLDVGELDVAGSSRD
ncbi:MAG: MarR family transcriptional regulator [Gammaproteobacteria bacterium]|nr:MarR family transcriptional regulator [Gammaproteobacteria bacterium]MCP5198508.1 MarR family transcriptional regulator [Gammaproteobacteria bacterium]